MRAAEWSRRGAACVRRAVAAGEARSGLEYLAAQCYVALAEKDTQRLAGLCRDGVRRFRGRPGVEELWLLRGVAEPGAALAHWTRAVEIRPRFYEAYLLRSEVHWAAGRLREAHRDLDRALSSRPAGLLARARRAQVRLALQDRAGALRDARQVYRLAPAGPRGAALWSRALREAGRPQEALPVAQEACREHPDRAFLLAELGRVWLALGRSQDAVSAFRRAILLEPRRARYYNLRGSALYGLERYRAARRDFEQALRLEPDNALGWFNLGNAELMLGRRRQAVGAYTKALEKRPTHREARRQRARLLTALGELEAARSDLAKLVQGARGWQERRQLGLSLYRCGDRGGGRQQLQRAAREAPPAARASILRVLRDLDAAGR